MFIHQESCAEEIPSALFNPSIQMKNDDDTSTSKTDKNPIQFFKMFL